MSKENVYAVYKGDTFIDLGTAKELGKRLGMLPKSIQFLTTPAYQRKLKNRTSTTKKGYMIVIKIEEDLEDDYR